MTDEIIIKAENVSKIYKLFTSKTERMKESLHPFKKKYHKEFYALDDIQLEVKKGEILGIVGMNGSGKSTLLKIIAGIIQQSSGFVKVTGNVVPLLELGAGFNPEFTGLENIYFYNTIMGHSRAETDKILHKILDFAEIGDFIHQPVKTYSSGMKARLSFAVSVNINPDILIIDEVLSVGDELFKRKSFSRIEEFFKAGKTILFVSHSAAHINQLCTRAIMLHQGNIVLQGVPKFVTMNYTKFMFSDTRKRENLLHDFQIISRNKSINNESLSLPEKEGDTPGETLKEIPYFIPNYVPRSTVITCNANLVVSDYDIRTLSGLRVNALIPHEEYIFSYKVNFNEDIGLVNFGTGFKSTHGVPISWKIHPGRNNYLDQVAMKGSEFKISWRFKCLFIPGVYFLNVSIRTQKDGLEMLIFKGADILTFKVLESDLEDIGGIFDASLSPKVEISLG